MLLLLQPHLKPAPFPVCNLFECRLIWYVWSKYFFAFETRLVRLLDTFEKVPFFIFLKNRFWEGGWFFKKWHWPSLQWRHPLQVYVFSVTVVHPEASFGTRCSCTIWCCAACTCLTPPDPFRGGVELLLASGTAFPRLSLALFEQSCPS